MIYKAPTSIKNQGVRFYFCRWEERGGEDSGGRKEEGKGGRGKVKGSERKGLAPTLCSFVVPIVSFFYFCYHSW